ncbi:MAG: SEL1-like repeat protein [Alphaproteobacteria bacterium]|nr:SEL1-like repeat protein [Alphaproteobacteria bacterium]
MAFKRTSEGRVFFKSSEDENKPSNGGLSIDPAELSKNDQSQMQILVLLKSLNAKLMDTQDERAVLKEELAKYRSELKALEEKATRSEQSYIDLEQKVAAKQKEAFKKTSRVEETIKETAKELEKARNLVEALEGKSQDSEEIIKSIKDDLNQRKKLEEEIITLQKTLEQQQREQSEKMAENLSAFVTLTKRVGDTEARQEALDNKIEEATTEFLKLDRKINKAIEDRSRMLRKLERIEESVQETREALNAKAMVLLTSQGRAGNADYPQIEDGSSHPLLLENQTGDRQAPRSFWARPFQIDASAMVMIVVIGLLLGWMISEIKNTQPAGLPGAASEKITWNAPPPPELEKVANTEGVMETPAPVSERPLSEELAQTDAGVASPVDEAPILPPDEMTENAADEPASEPLAKAEEAIEPEAIQRAIKEGDEQTLMAAFEENPDAVAAKLNEIEPSSLVSSDLKEPVSQENAPPAKMQKTVKGDLKKPLRERIQPDKTLPDQIRKVEEQAFAGVAEAQHDMGALYIAGRDPVKKDLTRAVFWFQEAADNGIANAKYNLGVLYHQGIGVKSDLSKALDLYSEAANLGHPEAQYNLGIAYIGGIGYPYDPTKAASNFESAANAGVMEAAYNLGLIYENGLLGKPQPDEALMWYKEAADKGSPEAKAALEQLAQSLGISINEVNRIVDAVKSAKKKGAANTASQEQAQKPKAANAAKPAPAPYPDIGVKTGSDTTSRQNLIADIQSELMRRGLYPGPVDGKPGPVTTDAIRTYQSAANMQIVDGTPTKELLDFMKSSAGVEQGSRSE